MIDDLMSKLMGCDQTNHLIQWHHFSLIDLKYEYKSKVACEDDKLRLSCKRSTVIAIYSAVFGSNHGGSLECPYHNMGVPAIECQSNAALQLMTKRCHGKRSCSVYASTYEFGDPCYPGIRKHLNVIYTCARLAGGRCRITPIIVKAFVQEHLTLEVRGGLLGLAARLRRRSCSVYVF
ncbi:UNVERIFIED_CONTAM: hypothetical protein K2H54_042129 [Gekko kuhli]